MKWNWVKDVWELSVPSLQLSYIPNIPKSRLQNEIKKKKLY